MTAAKSSDVVVVEDPRDLSRTLAESFCVAANNAMTARAVFSVALAGGSTRKASYALLASPPYRSLIQWRHVRFFFGDERCVPPDNPDSNYRTAREALFAPLEIPDANVFRMRGEDDPATAAPAYAQTLIRELGALPVLDLILLGMGADGHTASLFPGTPPDDGSQTLVRATVAPPDLPVRNRLTLTPHAINAARKIIVAVTGTPKAKILAQALNGPCDPTSCPVQIIAPTSGRCTWLADRAATALL
jgi:6-phosphogluconolactonase